MGKLNDTVELTVKITCSYPNEDTDGECRGSFHFTHAACTLEVLDEAGDQIGEVAGCLGGGDTMVGATIQEHGIWHMDPRDLWRAFIAAMQAKKRG